MSGAHERQRWATALVQRGRALGPLPRYGSLGWSALAETDPRRVAAVVVAAECWHQECDQERIAERLRDELAVAKQAEQTAEAEAFAAVAGAVRRMADVPTWAKVRERWGISA